MSLLFAKALLLDSSQLMLVFRKELVDCLRLDISALVKFGAHVVLTLTLDEESHVSLDEIHSQNIDHVRPLSFIFNQKVGDEVLQVLRIARWNRLLFVLNDLKD
jgi:hypothetical protein